MGSVWASLVPFAVATALMPIELVITLALLGAPGRVRTATAATIGAVLVRLLQGLIFGSILHWGQRDSTTGGHGWLASTILLVLAVILFVTATRELLGGGDPDDPPPKWLSALSSMTPTKAFLVGGATAVISVKMWVITLAAISVIGNANLPRSGNATAYLVFIVLGISTHIVIIAAAAFFPEKSSAFLDNSLDWLKNHNRGIMVTLGLGFGCWFLYKGLHGLGVV